MSEALLPRPLLENFGNVRNSHRSRAVIVSLRFLYIIGEKKTDIV
jgi:hypothetical protein